MSRQARPPDSRWSRRRFLTAAAGLALPVAACSNRFPAPEHGPYAVLFAGTVDDGGFNSLVLEAVTRAEANRGIPVQVTAVSAFDFADIEAALRKLARSEFEMIFGVGGRMSAPIQRVAWEFPQRNFTVLQGDLIRPNLAAYALREEEPAWLAGFLAARLSARRTIAVVSDAAAGRRTRIENAFRAGAMQSDSSLSVLSEGITSDQEEAVRRLAERADVIYGALDAAPAAAISASRAAGAKFIGCMRDWSPIDPDTVVASALADPGALFAAAVQDIVDAVWRGDYVRSFGMRYGEMLGFAVGSRVPPELAAEVRNAALDVASGRVAMPSIPSLPG